MSNGDAQQWVWPPPGIDVPPVASTSDFGPVHFGDSMVLEWNSGTQPEVVFSCFSQRGNETGLIIAQNQKSPVTYVMTDTAISQGASDLIFCHYYFSPSDHGNTVVFQFDNKPQVKPFTWSRNSIASASSSSSSSSTTSSSTTTSVATTTSSSISTPSSSPSQPANSDNTGGGGGLSAGASAGIGIGVAAAVLIVAVIIFLLIRRNKKNKATAATNSQQGQYQIPPDQHHQQSQQAQMSPMSGDQNMAYYSNYQGHPVVAYQDAAYDKTASPPPPPAELYSPYRPTELPS